MSTTSHFLGVNLNSELFLDLFSSIQNYLKTNHIEKAIEFQNLSTLHIALYYFGKKLDSVTLLKIKSDLSKLNKKENTFPLYINKTGLFEKDGQERLRYLYPSNDKTIKKINLELKQNYISEVVDNSYHNYIPHMTLFTIKDFTKYKIHQEFITSIINDCLERIKLSNAFKAINLYSVNSNFSPEKQKVIL